MANRHAHKKLVAEVRARMAATGESYQTARQRILARRQPRGAGADVGIDLVPLSYFGVPVTLATLDAGPIQTVVMIRHGAPPSRTFTLPLVTWVRPTGVN